MKKHILGFAILLLMSSSVFSQSEKNLVFDANAQIRKVASFNSIEVSGAINLFLSQGAEEAVAVSAGDEELINRIRTSVRDNVLHIDFDGKGLNWRNWSNNKIKAYVTFNSLKKIEAAGACNIKTVDQLKSNDLKIELSGASDLTGDIAVDNLSVVLSGASNCTLKGIAEKAAINCNGASSAKAYDLKVNYAKIDASGASSIRVTVNKEMNARASGASSISYKGEGLIKDLSSSGAASVKHRTD
jgi:hypothetical protein